MPTNSVNPSKDNTICRDEIFGPVLAIQKFKTEEGKANHYLSDLPRALLALLSFSLSRLLLQTSPSFNVLGAQLVPSDGYAQT